MAVITRGSVNPGSVAAGNIAVCLLFGQDCDLYILFICLHLQTPRGHGFESRSCRIEPTLRQDAGSAIHFSYALHKHS